MEEIIKNTDLSPKKNKVKDLTKKEKEKKELSSIKKKLSLISDNLYKFDITYKNKEINKFKEDILSYFRERDYFYLEKINNLKCQTDITDKNLDNLSDTMQKNFNTILSNQAEINTSFDKLKSYDAFVNKANDKLISHEIRINSIREDLTKTSQKYDKIYLDNLEVPGYIGRCSKYANCKIFFTEIIKELDKFNTYREKNIIDLCTYKERLENIIKTFQSLVDNNNDSQIKYITKLNDKTSKNLLETLEEKITNVRVDNSRFVTDLIKKTTELNELYNKMNIMKDNLFKEFSIKTDELNKKSDETIKSFDSYKVEYSVIRKKFFELADFIRSGRFSRNFGSVYGKKEINAITKKLVKETRDSIDAKDVKLLDNIEEVKKMEFKQKNINENKPNHNNLNNIKNITSPTNNRLSKSQNNFYPNNNIGKKKNYGFWQNNTKKNYNEKNTNSVDNTNSDMKVHQGLLFYLGNNITDNDSLKSTKRNKLRNNLIYENDKIKNLKNVSPIDKSNIQEQKKTNENKDKKDNNNNLDNLKNEKTKTEEKRITMSDELSISESCISNINNSINTFSTTNEKNNSINSLINNNKNCNKFNLFDEENHNDKIIKELASELEQSTAKVNKLTSNKKEIEEKFKTICNKIEPINLKLEKSSLEKIPEQKIKSENNKTKDKDTNNINKSEQNTTVLSHNTNNNTNNNINNNIGNMQKEINNNINNDGIVIKTNKAMVRNNKLKALVDLNEKIETKNNITIKSNKSKDISKNNTNETLLNDTINFSIDKKMNIYDKKLTDLESFTREQLFEVIKQINIIKKSYSYLTNIIKREKSPSAIKKGGFNTTHNNLIELSNGNGNIFNNNENKNILNLTGNNFHKKSPKNEININFGSSKKLIQAMDDINFNDNLFYNGKYYFNIKDIFEKNKNSNFNIENKILLKQIDNKFLEENASKNRIINSGNKNRQLKNDNSSLGGVNDNKWCELKKLSSGNIKYN